MKFNFRKPNLGNQINRSHPLARGLVDCWLMNEGGGGKVYDLSGNNNTGTLYAQTAWAAGKFGSCLSFDGADDYVRASLDGTSRTKLTVSFRVNPAQTESTQRGIFQWASSLSATAPFILIARAASSTNIRFHVDGDYRLATSIPNAAWSYISITLNQNNLWTFYVNGTAAGIYQDDSTHVNQVNAGSVYLGNGYNGYFNGSIDTLMIWNRDLLVSEIQWLYREPFAMFEMPSIGRFYAPPAGGTKIPLFMHHYKQMAGVA